MGSVGARGTAFITLLTDFGLTDPYVGIMKGVILGINPKACIVDISHQIDPGHILQASFILKEAFPYFPKGTIHTIVVDPGVGSERRAILLVTEDYLFVAPDNGLLWPIISEHKNGKVIHLTEARFFRPCISDTFHGRDIFAPVAAHLSLGQEPFDMGPIINDPLPLRIPEPKRRGHQLEGQVIRIDRFGNLITNIDKKALEELLQGRDCIVQVGSIQIKGVSRTYADVSSGKELVLIGSSEHLEIAVNQGNARERLGPRPSGAIGARVVIKRA
ncbi:MAG: SAM-dependent chlorinase/fluorinase [Deltaproteobacteria bacterium]|nr:SAM-dependent chlorinase/fluorinase [Deltaproteobacteria bacterium]MBW1927948.1 SAM-dependent chlorinase/fluorinase [Deltaproteobacteria bacterium]MBW2024811.1 SAM-dependent chlorinase/fluorinase [Deltaproteobacteria bacterium]MBW2124709.1 SAM-dependent chlorinase/fluorinase [Deltaproteobacteria bacterium]